MLLPMALDVSCNDVPCNFFQIGIGNGWPGGMRRIRALFEAILQVSRLRLGRSRRRCILRVIYVRAV